LKTKAEEYKNTKVNVVTEEYTSQECLFCRMRTKTKSEIYKCKHCGYKLDRDILGSVNILLKHW
jgi:putative transposase